MGGWGEEGAHHTLNPLYYSAQLVLVHKSPPLVTITSLYTTQEEEHPNHAKQVETSYRTWCCALAKATNISVPGSLTTQTSQIQGNQRPVEQQPNKWKDELSSAGEHLCPLPVSALQQHLIKHSHVRWSWW